ncbi:MAG: hypothetical protein ABL917_03815 [Parcubacteria group bacterium]
MKDDSLGILVIIGLILIALASNQSRNNSSQNGTVFYNTQNDPQKTVQENILDKQNQVQILQNKLETERVKNNESKYKGIVTLNYPVRSTDPKQEYISIKVNNTPNGILVTGWKLVSSTTGTSVSIPKASYLLFTTTQNTEENIYLRGGDTLYLVTGISPNGSSFKINKCSGYLAQFQTFNPSLNNDCPAPRNENLSSIPRTSANDACLDYLDSFPSCRIQTETLPLNWGYECKNFIYEKLNYNSCINTHKNDADFYKNEWRVYLKRSDSIWKEKRETITLYDNDGRIVDSIKY